MKMEGKHPSQFTPDQESFLALATGQKTEMDDITMSSLPGTPIAASTVMRQKGAMQERISANGKDSRGSLFGSNDPSLALSNDSPQLMVNQEDIIEESPLENKTDEGFSEEHLALSLQENSSDNVEFLRTHQVSGLLQKMSLSQHPLSDIPCDTRQSFMSQNSDTSLGILNLDSMQDITAGITDESNQHSLSQFHDESDEKEAVNSISGKERKDAVNQILKASKKTDMSSDTPDISRGQGSTEGQVLTNSIGQTSQRRLQRGNLYGRSHPEHIGDRDDVAANDSIMADRSPSPATESQDKSREGTTRDVYQRMRTLPQADRESSIHLQRKEEQDGSLMSTSTINPADGRREAQIAGGWSDKGSIMSGKVQSKTARGIASDKSNSKRSDGERSAVGSKSSGPVSLGLGSLNPEEEEEHEIDLASLQVGLNQLDAMFFNPSPNSKSQRSGSGDGEESHCSSIQQSPRMSRQSRGDWPSNLQAAQHIRSESQISATFIDFGDAEDQGNFLQDALEDKVNESEIDTEDEIEAVRKESQQGPETVMDDFVRPGIEGGSSGEEDASPPASNLEPRQSAEGVVAVSPVPGDGGGGGDGMSDRESDSGASSIGERSPVRNGVFNGTGRFLDGEQGSDDADLSDGRDVEGQTRFQPVGDGSMDSAVTAGRQVRFASHDDVTRWTPSGSAFHSRLRRPNSDVGNGDESLFPPTSATPPPQEDPSLLLSQFLQPSNNPSFSGLHGDLGEEWSRQGDSLIFSQRLSHPDQPTDMVTHGGLPTSQSREFERTLTPGASPADDLLPLRGCSIGSFGALPTRGYTDVTGPLSEDFLVLRAEGVSMSDASTFRSSEERGERHSNRRSVQGESNISVITSEASQVVYLDGEGRGVTNLAFRTSLPMMHKLGTVNPFESFDNQDAVEKDIMDSIDFGVDLDEEFLPFEQAAAVLDADESEFVEANVFHQDEQMSPDPFKEASEWSIRETSHVTVKDDITGHEDFCRISLGTFFGKRTGALGSLSGTDTQRPTFGDDDIVSPPARELVPLVDTSQQPESSHQESVSPHHWSDGGGHGKENGSVKNDVSRSESIYEGEKRTSATLPLIQSSIDLGGDNEDVAVGGFPPFDSAGGTETPPLNLSDIAGIIGELSSKSNSEEILQKIIALSNKRSSTRQIKPGNEQSLKDDERKRKGATSKERKPQGNESREQQRRSRSSAHGSRHRLREGRELGGERRDGRERRMKGSSLKFDETKASTAVSAVYDVDTRSKDSGVISGISGIRTNEWNQEHSLANHKRSLASRSHGGVVRKCPPKRTAVATGVGSTHTSSFETHERVENIDSYDYKIGPSSARDKQDNEIRKQTKVLNTSQNGSHLSQELKEPDQVQRRGIGSIDVLNAGGTNMDKRGTSFRESVVVPNQEGENCSWATSSSIRKSSLLSQRGFFKTSPIVDREMNSLSPTRFEMNERRSSVEEEQEEEISPILGKGIELDGQTHISRHFEHPSTLLREEFEPDGEPNSTEMGTVGGLPPIPQTSKFQSNTLSVQAGHNNNDKYLGENFDPSTEMDDAPLELTLQSSSRKSINSKGMFVVGQHKVKQLSASLLMQSFNDTLYPNSKSDIPSQPVMVSTSASQDHVFVSSQRGGGGLSSQECTTSSTLSSEEEAGHKSPSPPSTLPISISSSDTRQERRVENVQTRLEIDGEEARRQKVQEGSFPGPSTSMDRASCQTRPDVSATVPGRDPSFTIGHYGQIKMHASAPLPTLLTSQSLMDTHLANQIVNSRPGSSLSGNHMDPGLSVQSVDSYQPSLSGHSVSSQYGPGLSSHHNLGDTFSNLGMRPCSSQLSASQDLPLSRHLQTFPYHEHLRQTQPGMPYQDYWHHGSLTAREPTPHPAYLTDGTLAINNQPHSFLTSQQQAPIMSIGAVPYGATHLGATGMALPSYTHFPCPVSTFNNNLHMERRPNSLNAGSIPPDYQRGPLSRCLDLPANVRFQGVCCVGIASHTSLPLRNSSTRWLHCFMDIVQVTANGEEMEPEGHSTFIVKQRTTIAPHGIEQIKIIFVPKHPGIYTALLHVGWSTVVQDGDRNNTPHVPPQVIPLQAIAESPCVEVLENSDVFFGEVVHQSRRTKSLHIINRGRCTVPVRLLVTSSSSSFNCFSVSSVEKSDAASSTYQRGTKSITPLHISLKGHPGSDNDDALATATTIWVHFKAPTKPKETEKKRDAETLSARMDIEMDVPEKILTLHSVNLRAVVGTANLHIPRNMHILNFSTSVGNKESRKLPLKNSGSIRLDVKFAISRAEELFSVLPESLKLKPEEETTIEITYAPKEAPSAVESLLTMKAEGDGPQFDVVMRGVGTVEEKKASTKAIPCLYSNKQFLSWGGVAVGRALQQKVVLRNSSSSMPLKFKVSITGGPEFQLQSSFGSQLQLSDSKSLIMKPDEDLPVNILYAPTMVTTSQGLLVMKPIGGCSKYTVPLSGYGGVSSLSVDELQMVGETPVLAVGNVIVGQRKVFNLKVCNNGDRAAFVKVLCFSDLKAKIKLPKIHLNVEPHEFVIPAKAVEKLSVVYQPMEQDAALCYCQSSMVAAVGFFSGDEIMRKQYQKALKIGQANDFHMSADNPLRGVLFDKTFLKEQNENSEYGLPTRPNDVDLFYNCMDRVMVAIVGDASTGTQDADQINGNMGNLTMAINGQDIVGTGMMNRPERGSVSPPVKGTPAHHQPPSSADHHQATSLLLSSGTWSLHPDQLILTWTPSTKHSHVAGRIHFYNYTERKLSFELAWPGHILTVTPQNGMVEPNEQTILLVSANPSIQSKGVILPWSGTIYVSCDNQEKEIKVQIREDLALDTSIFQTSSKQLRSLSTQPSTPAASRRPLPTATVSPKEFKVRSKVIICEDAHVDQTTEFIFEFENIKSYPMKWNLSSFAPAYLRQADGTVCRTTYSVFRFASTSGEMTPGHKMQLSLHFMPREEGAYSQFWDLESSSTQNLVSHKTRIELSGHGLPKNTTPQTDKYSRTVPKPNLYDQALAKQLSKSQLLDLTKVSKSVSFSQPTKMTAMTTGKGQRHNTKKPSIVISEFVKFDRCGENKSQTGMVQLKNCSTNPLMVKFVSPQQPFSITHHERMIKPRHYLKLPVTFHPKTKGHYEAPLVIQTELQENFVVRLIGECL